MSVYFSIIIVMCSFAAIAVGLILGFVRYQKNILAKQRELHHLDAQYKQELLANSIASAEAERTRIAKDIHDELGSIFSTLSLSINQVKSEDAADVLHYRNCKKLVENGIQSVRRISHAIIPFELQILGLEQTLENHLESISNISGIPIQFSNRAKLEQLNENAALGIYRILQELTSNSMKYALAKEVSVEISTNSLDNAFSVLYKDNGIGTNLENVRSKKGIGLKNIESRALALNGSSDFVSKPGEGFSCTVSIPYHKNTVAC